MLLSKLRILLTGIFVIALIALLDYWLATRGQDNTRQAAVEYSASPIPTSLPFTPPLAIALPDPIPIDPPQQTVYPHQRFKNPDCPQYLTGNVHTSAGLGHKSFNYYSMLTAAQHLGLKYLHRPFASTSKHTNYDSSIADWLGFGIGEQLATDPEVAHLPVIQLPQWTGEGKRDTQQAFLPIQSYLKTHSAACNVIFLMPLHLDTHFAPVPMYSIKPAMEDKYRRARMLDPMPALEFNANEINLGIYLRNGDITPTSETWLVNAAAAVLEVLRGYPVHIHVFSFLAPAFSGITNFTGTITFHVNQSIQHTLHHIINADIVVRSASSFAEVAIMASTKPLFVHPPTREKDMTWDACYRGGICLGPEYTHSKLELSPSNVQLIQEVCQRWQTRVTKEL